MYKNKAHGQSHGFSPVLAAEKYLVAFRGWILDHYTHFTAKETKV